MKITNWGEHKTALNELDKLIKEGFEENAQREAPFSKLAVAIETFEDSIPIMPTHVPETLPDMITSKWRSVR